MVDDVSSFDELHVVYFSSCLYPLEAEFVRELHATRHRLVASLEEGVLGQPRVVADSDEAVLGKGLGGSIAIDLVVVEDWRVKVSLIIVTISRIHTKD